MLDESALDTHKGGKLRGLGLLWMRVWVDASLSTSCESFIFLSERNNSPLLPMVVATTRQLEPVASATVVTSPLNLFKSTQATIRGRFGPAPSGFQGSFHSEHYLPLMWFASSDCGHAHTMMAAPYHNRLGGQCVRYHLAPFPGQMQGWRTWLSLVHVCSVGNEGNDSITEYHCLFMCTYSKKAIWSKQRMITPHSSARLLYYWFFIVSQVHFFLWICLNFSAFREIIQTTAYSLISLTCFHIVGGIVVAFYSWLRAYSLPCFHFILVFANYFDLRMVHLGVSLVVARR